MITLAQAAQARSARVAAPADRPSQRRCAEAAGSPARVVVRSKIELRAQPDSDLLQFDGYASVTETGYEMWDFFGPYTEVVSAGAFADTLNRADLDVPLVLQHDQLRRLARTTNGTLTLAEDDHGLRVLADLDPTDADVAYIAPKLRAGLIDEMSFAFRITSGRWSPDYMQYSIDKVDLHRGDTAIVGFGANPATAGSGLRDAVDLAQLLRDASDDDARAALAQLRNRFPSYRVVLDPRLPLV